MVSEIFFFFKYQCTIILTDCGDRNTFFDCYLLFCTHCTFCVTAEHARNDFYDSFKKKKRNTNNKSLFYNRRAFFLTLSLGYGFSRHLNTVLARSYNCKIEITSPPRVGLTNGRSLFSAHSRRSVLTSRTFFYFLGDFAIEIDVYVEFTKRGLPSKVRRKREIFRKQFSYNSSRD